MASQLCKAYQEIPLSSVRTHLAMDEETAENAKLIDKSDSHADINTMQPKDAHGVTGKISRAVFKHPSELFYDLFFVANLTTFTNAHAIIDHKTLVSYVGFFIILWFTWLQVALFDLRMSRDSFFDRFSKAVQFGVMIGFVVVGSEYDPDLNIMDGKTLSLLLMGSRLILALQYGYSLYDRRHDASSRIPLLIVVIATFLSSVFYLGFSFDFTSLGQAKSTYSYVAWYVVAPAETVINIWTSSHCRQLSFKGTDIVKRMGLLTLIILGEGIIGLCDRVQVVASAQKFSYGMTSDFVGIITSALLLIYFLYMLYFDTLPRERFGSIRQQLWVFSHLPFHVCLVLFLEGSTSFVIWGKAQSVANTIESELSNIDLFNEISEHSTLSPLSSNSTEYFVAAATQANATINAFFDDWGIFAESEDVSTEVYSSIYEIKEGVTRSLLLVAAAILDIIFKLFEVIFACLQIEVPKASPASPENGLRGAVAAWNRDREFETLYNLVMLYFFICGGCALLLLGLLYTMNNNQRSGRFDVVRMATFPVIGATLALLSTLEIGASKQSGAGYSLVTSPWVIPTAMLCLFVVVATLHAPIKW